MKIKLSVNLILSSITTLALYASSAWAWKNEDLIHLTNSFMNKAECIKAEEKNEVCKLRGAEIQIDQQRVRLSSGQWHNLEPVDERLAKWAFLKIKNDLSYRWDYYENYCYERAHIAAYELSKMNISSVKIFNFCFASMTRFDSARWFNHVAVIILVRSMSGQLKLQVFDPTLFDDLVSPAQWLEEMRDPRAMFAITLPYTYSHTESNWIFEDAGGWDLKKLNESRKTLETKTNAPQEVNF